MNDKILDTYKFELICERKAFEKDGSVFQYFDLFTYVMGVKVPIEPKDKNKVSMELIKAKCNAIDVEKNKGGIK